MGKIQTLLTCLLISAFFFGNAQNTYIRIDSAYTYGIDIINGPDILHGKICSYYKGNEIFEYTPYEISEYCTKNKRVFVSENVRVNRIIERRFLEKLTEGELILYYLRSDFGKHYFYKNSDEEIIEIIKKDQEGNSVYRKILSEQCIICGKTKDLAEKTHYNKKDLIKFTNYYNTCISDPDAIENFSVRNISFGIYGGVSGTKLITSKNSGILFMPQINTGYDLSLTGGIYADIPLSNNNFSFIPEFRYSENTYSLSNDNNTMISYLLMNIKSIYIPLKISYNIKINKINPFLGLGTVYSYTLRFDQKTYRSYIYDNIISTELIETDDFMSKHHLGYTISCGIQHPFKKSLDLFYKIEYSKLYDLSNPYKINRNIFQFTTGINF